MTQAVPRFRADARPTHGRTVVEALAGTVAQWTPVGGHDGVELWRVSGLLGSWKLKAGVGPGAASVAREAAVRSQLTGMWPAVSNGSRTRHGSGGGAAWLATPWVTGPTLWELFAPVRDRTGKCQEEVLGAAVDTCVSVAAVHLRGWVHGDLQPHHVIVAPDGARLIDWSRAWSADSDVHPAGGAGLVHLASPEMLARAERPTCTTAADETWMLAAMIWWAASGRWPRDYRALGIDPSMFTETELAKVIVRHPAPFGGLDHWRQLDTVLRAVLDAPEASRPPAADLALQLSRSRMF